MKRNFLLILAGVIFFLSYVMNPAVELLTDFWWFDALGYAPVFWQMLMGQLGVYAAIVTGIFIVLYLNALIAVSQTQLDTDNFDQVFQENAALFRRYFQGVLVVACIAIGLFLGRISLDQWLDFLQFFHQQPFGLEDPLFHKDVGFYVFSLPFINHILGWLSAILFLSMLGSLVVYFLRGAISSFRNRFYFSARARNHLFVLAMLFFVLKAVSYYFERYGLLYSHRGVVYGAGYTDVHVMMPGYYSLIALAAIAALAFLSGVMRRSWQFPVLGLIFLMAGSFLVNSLAPGLYQKYFVEPNEITKETPYLTRNIEFTRKAYNLDTIESADFPAEENLSRNDLQANSLTIDNIRLWDWEALQQTYSQLQEIRSYYTFKDGDVDRYVLDGRYRQVVLSARELNYKKTTQVAQTWINQHFQYTHGYGICVSPVNVFTPEGLPEFFVKDIPPVASTVDLEIKRPEIYFGELTEGYVFVKGDGIEEFDYPKGDTNQMAVYAGNGGTPTGSWLRRLVFALKWRELNLLFTGHIGSQTRVMYYREIKERVTKIAPFLQLDSDPYPVIADGRIFWMLDAYTMTNMFPYSQPVNLSSTIDSSKVSRPNYLRNSVKVIVDAYDGKVDFYIADPTDPIIRTYDSLFKGLFKPISEMPASLFAHLRYPQDLFKIQSQRLAVYHMEDSQVFYNREDMWNVPNLRPTEPGSGERLKETSREPTTGAMSSYYMILKLPGKHEAEMIQMLPFTPATKDNMIAWFSARCDGENYGKLLLYKFPKKKLTYGPMQVGARIDQDTEISKLMTLWSQKGSKVIRGSLLVIPIETSILYVQPVYLKAESSQMPELKQVIVAYSNRVVMRNTLTDALRDVFGEASAEAALANLTTDSEMAASTPSAGDEALMAHDLAVKARALYESAQTALKNGEWAVYGQKMNELARALAQLEAKTQSKE